MFGFATKSYRFFDDFVSVATEAVAAATDLLALVNGGPASGAHYIRSIRDHEHEADQITHAALARLDRTFQTPIHREDIHDLIQALDTVIDSIQSLADRLQVFHVRASPAGFTQLAAVLVDSTVAVHHAVTVLKADRRLVSMRENLTHVRLLENGANNIHASSVSSLFLDPVEVMDVIRWKDLYDLALLAVDQCEDVANILQRISLQNG